MTTLTPPPPQASIITNQPPATLPCGLIPNRICRVKSETPQSRPRCGRRGASLDDDLLHLGNRHRGRAGVATGVVGAGFISAAVLGFAIMWLVMRTTCGGREM